MTVQEIFNQTGIEVSQECAAYVTACQVGSKFGTDTTYELITEYLDALENGGDYSVPVMLAPAHDADGEQDITDWQR